MRDADAARSRADSRADAVLGSFAARCAAAEPRAAAGAGMPLAAARVRRGLAVAAAAEGMTSALASVLGGGGVSGRAAAGRLLRARSFSAPCGRPSSLSHGRLDGRPFTFTLKLEGRAPEALPLAVGEDGDVGECSEGGEGGEGGEPGTAPRAVPVGRRR